MEELVRKKDVETLLVFSDLVEHKTCEEVAKALQTLPVIKSGEGEWIDSYDASRICGIELKICSICGREYNIGLAKTFNYCPNCGCRMKREDDDSQINSED